MSIRKLGRQILAGNVIELPDEGVFFVAGKNGGPHLMLGGGLRTDAIWWALQQILDELKPWRGKKEEYERMLAKSCTSLAVKPLEQAESASYKQNTSAQKLQAAHNAHWIVANCVYLFVLKCQARISIE